MMADDLAKDVKQEWEREQADRGAWLTHCQQVANYLQPYRNDYITQRAPGAKRMQWVYDATPIYALDKYKSGLHSRLTSPTLPWLALHLDNERIDRNYRVRAWMDAATADLYNIFSAGRYGFGTSSIELYGDYGAIGMGVMSVLGNAERPVNFRTHHPKESTVFEGEDGRINKNIRRWDETAKVAWERWGEKAGPKVAKAYADGKETEKFWFLHRVGPRKNRDPQRADAKHKPFESVYVAEADEVVISEGGFDEFPYMVPRGGRISGQVYPYGRGMQALPDVKMLQELMKLVLKGAQKQVDPPLMLPDDGFIVPVKTTPGSLNYYRAGTRPTDRIAAIETKGDARLGNDMLQALRQQIMTMFSVDLMIMPTDPSDPASAGKGVTATFTNRQEGENNMMLSPLLSELQDELLDPEVARVFAMRWRQSLAMRFGPGSPFPPPPPELRGQPWHAEYLSPIALAQKAARFDPVKRLLQTQLELKQMDPTTPMVLDAEAILRLEAEDTNAPIAVLKSPDRLAAELQKAAAQQQQQHEAEIASQVAGAANQGAGAVKNMADAHANAGGQPGMRMAA